MTSPTKSSRSFRSIFVFKGVVGSFFFLCGSRASGGDTRDDFVSEFFGMGVHKRGTRGQGFELAWLALIFNFFLSR